LKRCQTDLFYLCSEVLGYKWNPEKQQGMTEAFHGPMCARADRLHDHERVFTAAHRGSLKTSVFTIGGTIQDILRDPDTTTLIPHAVEDEAVKIVAEITNHIRQNDRLRKLEPSIMPAPNGKWWYGSGRMKVRGGKYSRQPTVMGVGAGSEITGAHVDVIRPDDIIGRRTIENSELPKIHAWWQNTALPVLNPAGRISAVGTRWHTDDIWGTFIASPGWDCLVRACSEIDGVADYTLQNPVHFGPEAGGREKAVKRLERAREEMRGDFDAQMMNNPSPASEKPWSRECEHHVDAKYVVGAGQVYIIHDPAPARTGSLDATGAKARADGTKDFWAIVAVKLRRNGDRKEIIWIDGDQSREWDLDGGIRRGFEMARKWGARRIAFEAVGLPGKIYEDRARAIAREEGAKYTPVELTQTYKGKNLRFAALCSRGKADELLIAETVPQAIRDVFLAQAREWRPLDTGRNSLKYDDLADCLSYATDPALDQYAMSEKMQEWSPFRREETTEMMQGGRYVRW
jgi:hypothetical protein